MDFSKALTKSYDQIIVDINTIRERLDCALEGSNDGLWDWNLSTHSLFLSPRWKAQLGYSDAELGNTLQTWQALVHPEELNEVVFHPDRHFSPANCDYKAMMRMRHKEGRWIWMLVRGRVTHFDTESKPLRIVGVQTDISEIKELRAIFESIFEQAAVGMAIVGIDGHWLRVNHKLCAIVGYEEEELLNLTFQQIAHSDDLQPDMDYVGEMLRKERKEYSMRKRYIRKDGTITSVLLTVALTWKDETTPDYFISVIEDINRLVESEEALKKQVQKTHPSGHP